MPKVGRAKLKFFSSRAVAKLMISDSVIKSLVSEETLCPTKLSRIAEISSTLVNLQPYPSCGFYSLHYPSRLSDLPLKRGASWKPFRNLR